uniref:Uncharacterized protein n=1 Tax=Romanomermis culicivorax TaxID=13658 RepID=A0A915HPI2_ROMCU
MDTGTESDSSDLDKDILVIYEYTGHEKGRLKKIDTDLSLQHPYDQDDQFALQAKMLPGLAIVPIIDVIEEFDILTGGQCIPELNLLDWPKQLTPTRWWMKIGKKFTRNRNDPFLMYDDINFKLGYGLEKQREPGVKSGHCYGAQPWFDKSGVVVSGGRGPIKFRTLKPT